MTLSRLSLEDRFARLRACMADADVDFVLVGPSADYRYLTGMLPPLPTRKTFLIVPLEGQVELVTPSLEAAGLETHEELSGLVEPVPWDDGDDPAAVAAARVRSRGTPARVAVSYQTWARHLVPLFERLPGSEIVTAGPLIGAVRANEDADEIAALAECRSSREPGHRPAAGSRVARPHRARRCIRHRLPHARSRSRGGLVRDPRERTQQR